jgi:cell division inhibitor SulA
MKNQSATLETEIQLPMKGQENWTSGLQLRWVIDTNEQGPAKIYNSIGRCVYNGTYSAAINWLTSRGNSPA